MEFVGTDMLPSVKWAKSQETLYLITLALSPPLPPLGGLR